MAITPADFNKIWATNSVTPGYNFTDAEYQEGWDFVGNLPPSRGMWNSLQKLTDEKMQYVLQNFGHPFVASSSADMTDTSKVYVYVGSEAGYTNGDWYYYNGATWVSGGAYNSTALVTDKTLSLSDEPADAEVTGERIGINTDNLKTYNIFDVFGYNSANSKTGTSHQVTFIWDKTSSTVTCTGTADATAFSNLINSSTVLPYGFEKGKSYWVDYKSTNTDLNFRIYQYYTDGTSSSTNISESRKITLADNCKGIIVRANVSSGVTLNNDSATLHILTLPYATEDSVCLDLKYNGTDLLAGDDVDNYNYPGSWNVATDTIASSVSNLPFSKAGRLVYITSFAYSTTTTNRRGIQVYLSSDNRIAWRCFTGTGYTDWWENTHYIAPFDMGTTGVELTGGEDVDTYLTAGTWYVNSAATASTINGLPIATAGRLAYIVTFANGSSDTLKRGMQIYYGTRNRIYHRAWQGTSGWTAWKEVGEGGGGGGTIINNTYTITTSPTITASSNGWLAPIDTDSTPEANATDMTGAIMSMLTSTGYCHLGAGTFYVSGNIDMPDNSIIEGCGNSTVVKLLDSVSNGYVIRMGNFSRVQNLMVLGSKTAPTFTSTCGNRHGIWFVGNYDGNEDDTQYEVGPAYVNNVQVKWFSGNGIFAHNTSINHYKGLYVTDCMFNRCWCGVNIDYRTEFHKYTNCNISNCYIGCANNSGNNGFVNCVFHASTIGFLMDNSGGDKPNNAHGYMTGCTFCHTGSNTGSGITIKNISSNGFVFSTCQFHYNSIDIDNSYGMVFSNFEFGRGTTGQGATININGGGLVAFNGCLFINDVSRPPQFNILNNNTVKLNFCYGASGADITL